MSLGGSGLFLRSFNAVVDDVGVPWLEEMGDCVWALDTAPEPCDGEEVPEFDSFLFLDDLLESLARESCSC